MKKIYIALVLSLLGSCGKFLEPNSPSDFIPKHVSSLNEVLTSKGYCIGEGGYFRYLEIFCDDVQLTTENAKFNGADKLMKSKKFVKMTWDVFEPNKFSPWKSFFEGILHCNAALDYLDAVDGTESEKDYVKAQALFLRALHYFYLVNYYGSPYYYDKNALAVPIKLTSDLVDNRAPRNTVEEVYKVIVNDLLEAEKCWERIPDKHFKKDFRANYPATQFLLSKVYLFMENWSESKRYAEKVLKWEAFSLYNINTFKGTVSKPALDYGNYDSPETIWAYGSIKQFTEEMKNDNMDLNKLDPTDEKEKIYRRSAYIASNDLLSGYEEDDLRKDIYIFKEWGYDHDSGKECYLKTRLPYGKIDNSSDMTPTESAINMALKFRLSEAYLMLAESCAMLGDENEVLAINALNILRENRYATGKYTPLRALTGSDLIQFVRKERRLELCFEGSRWFDMRRFGMKSYVRGWYENGELVDNYIIKDNDPSFNFPINTFILEVNKGLVQNTLTNRNLD